VEKVSTLRAATVLPLIEVRSLDFSGDSEALDNGYSIMKRDVDPPPSRRYRSLGGKNEKEDVASRGSAFGRLSLRRMFND
jgi:hypothetical protein